MRHYNVVAAVVVLGGKYLCMQRCRSRYEYTSEKWEFPGGKIEPGETAPEALKREMREEMRYDINPIRSIAKVDYEYPDFSITLDAWLCTAETTDFIMLEHLDYKWLYLHQLDTLDWTAADRIIVEMMMKHQPA
jgi:8-oxo-dGTP diphosphatase